MLTYRQALQHAARRYLQRVLKRTHGDAAIAAKVAGCNRTTFYRILKRYGLPTKMYAHRGRWED